jgi:FkbM family methyltransferase
MGHGDITTRHSVPAPTASDSRIAHGRYPSPQWTQLHHQALAVRGVIRSALARLLTVSGGRRYATACWPMTSRRRRDRPLPRGHRRRLDDPLLALLLVNRISPSARLRLARILCRHLQPFGAGKCRRLLYPEARAKEDHLDFVVRAQTGSLFAGSTADYHAYPFAIHGYSDWRLWAVALALCRAGDTIVEVGANVGTETVGYSDIVGPTGRVIAFEPVPVNRRAVKRNLQLLRNDNVSLLPYVVSDRCGTTQFATPPEGMSSGIGHVLGPNERQSQTVTYRDERIEAAVIEVECRTLDSLADELGHVRLIAVDAEGSELAILRGGVGLLGRAAPVLILEANPWHQVRAGADLTLLHAELKKLGYCAFEIGRLGLNQVTNTEEQAVTNWLCLTNSQAHLAKGVERLLRRCALTPCLGHLNPLATPKSR